MGQRNVELHFVHISLLSFLPLQAVPLFPSPSPHDVQSYVMGHLILIVPRHARFLTQST